MPFGAQIETARLRLRLALHGRRRPVLVYQMGKVGSLALRDSLVAAGVPLVLHAHNLRPGVRDPRYRWMRRVFVEAKRPADIVTLVRDPIARGLSAFFEHAGECDAALPVPELTARFLASPFADEALSWFDRQLEEVLGIDVYAQPFAAGAGAVSIAQGPYRLLVLKTEAPDPTKEAAVAAFLGLHAFHLRAGNVTAGKRQGAAYLRFLAGVALPSDYVERTLGSRYARHFYTAQERAAFRERWQACPRSVPA